MAYGAARSFPTAGGSRLPSSASQGKILAGVAAVAVIVVIAAASNGSGAKHTLTGTYDVYDAGMYLSDGESCEYQIAQDGYSDVSSGSEIDVVNQSGSTVAFGQLEGGYVVGGACEFTFTIPDVPSASTYGVTMGDGSRGTVHYSQDELNGDNWDIAITLGQ